jgi:hypothetical protein
VACKMPRECNLLLKLLPAKATCPHFLSLLFIYNKNKN